MDKFKNKDIFTVQENGGLKYFFYTAIIYTFPLQVNYNPDSISTILSFKDSSVIPGARITTDTSKYMDMFITLESKSRECASGLYY